MSSEWMDDMGNYALSAEGRGDGCITFLVSAQNDEQAWEDMQKIRGSDPRIFQTNIYKIKRLPIMHKEGDDFGLFVYIATGAALIDGKQIRKDDLFVTDGDNEALDQVMGYGWSNPRLYRCELLRQQVSRVKKTIGVPRDPKDCGFRLSFPSKEEASGWVRRPASSFMYQCDKCVRFHLKNLGPEVGNHAKLQEASR